jgi:hypothetical protein
MEIFRNLPHLKGSFDFVTTLVLGHEQRSFTVLLPTNGRFSSIGRLSIVTKPSPLSIPHGGNTAQNSIPTRDTLNEVV